MREKRDAEEDDKCIVCFEETAMMVNSPCGHGGLCQGCAMEIFRKKGLCLLCREVLYDTDIFRKYINCLR